MRTILALVLLAIAFPLSARAADTRPCKTASFEGSAFTVCRYERGADEIRLALKGPTGVIGGFKALSAVLGPDRSRVLFAMNAGMFEPSRGPVGLYVEAGATLHPPQLAEGTGNFYLKPNGVFWIGADGGAHIDETAAFTARPAHPLWATQSGPLLMKSGVLHPRVAANGASLLIRNGVGVKTAGEALFVISDQPVSFGRFARFLRDGLGCPDVLYLDGTVSSLWAPGLGRQDSRANLGPLVVVLRRK